MVRRTFIKSALALFSTVYLPVFRAAGRKIRGFRELKRFSLSDLYKKHKWAG